MNYFLKNGTLKFFFTNVLIAFGTIWLLVEFPSSVSQKIRNFYDNISILLLIFSVIFSLIYGFVRILPKTRIIKKFKASNTSVEIKVGNIFEENGNIAIGSSNYFDTEFEIANSSLKSQLIDRIYSKDKNLVDDLISTSINRQNLIGEIDNTKPIGKKVKFPLGSAVRLPHKERSIFILIISEILFDGTRKHTQSSPLMLNTALYKFWETIKTEGGMKPITIPVFGSGLARVNLSFLLLMQLIILSFVTYTRGLRITDKLTIIVNKDNYNPGDFEELTKFLESIEI